MTYIYMPKVVDLNISHTISMSYDLRVSSISENEDDIECPICCIKGLGCQWICCDNCDTWYHTHCTDVDPDNVPNIFFCTSCV